MRILRILGFVMVVCILLTGCRAALVNDVSTIPPTQSPNPINGFVLPVEGQRPIAVMIDNAGDKPLPQGGLDKAQIIYEALAEGGLTRYMAVFWGAAPEKIGPVRSSRHYFVEYALEHDAIYVHYGWSPQAQEIISELKVNNINGLTAPCFWDITTDKGNWQDSYTSYDKLMDYASKLNYRTETDTKLTFAYHPVMTPISQVDAKTANTVSVYYNSYENNKYVYDEKTQLYMRLRNGVKHMERNSGKQLSTGNIIVQYVQNYNITDDPKNRQEMKNIGKGNGLYITMGKVIPIQWSKSSQTAKTLYKYEDGSDLVLNPSQTWIQIVPPSISAKIN